VGKGRRTVAGDRKLIDGKACYVKTTSYVLRVERGEEEHGVMGFCVGEREEDACREKKPNSAHHSLIPSNHHLQSH